MMPSYRHRGLTTMMAEELPILQIRPIPPRFQANALLPRPCILSQACDVRGASRCCCVILSKIYQEDIPWPARIRFRDVYVNTTLFVHFTLQFVMLFAKESFLPMRLTVKRARDISLNYCSYWGT